jgi:hypothetical protein
MCAVFPIAFYPDVPRIHAASLAVPVYLVARYLLLWLCCGAAVRRNASDLRVILSALCPLFLPLHIISFLHLLTVYLLQSMLAPAGSISDYNITHRVAGKE